jgi:hypothetical protein
MIDFQVCTSLGSKHYLGNRNLANLSGTKTLGATTARLPELKTQSLQSS